MPTRRTGRKAGPIWRVLQRTEEAWFCAGGLPRSASLTLISRKNPTLCQVVEAVLKVASPISRSRR